ncbi:MAG: sugar ABC transporter ATP-binding protein [Bacillota bacterium]
MVVVIVADEFVLRMEHVSKSFPGVRALHDVSLSVRRGEIHCLVGQNGAGKSTLMKILGGAYRMDGGDILLDGEKMIFPNPHAALKAGISVLYQELALNPCLSATENIFLGREIRTPLGTVNARRQHQEAERLIEPFGVEVDVAVPVEQLSVAQQQIIAIAKALSFRAKVIVLDEPSAVLTVEELGKLFNIMKGLQRDGVAIIYISHRLEEIFEIGDRVTVLRDGEVVGTFRVSDVTQSDLVRMMTGREVVESNGRVEHSAGAPVLEVRNLSRRGVLTDVSLHILAGEIVGVFGLVGAGRTELAHALVGADRSDSGTIILDGKEVKPSSPRHAMRLGIGLVPEDRKRHGLVLGMSVADNSTLTIWEQLSKFGVVNARSLHATAKKSVDELRIKVASLSTLVENLSGGNQQKVVLAKWLATACRVLILDEPTRGVDVGAKTEIHALIRAIAGQGKALLVISSELSEIMAISDRLIVMRKGSIAGEFVPKETTQEDVLACAMGVRVA